MTRPLVRVGSSDPSRLRDAIARALDGSGPAVQPVDESSAPLSAAPAPLDAPEDLSVPDDVAVVVATSGSSGYPKRVAHSATALRASAVATHDRLGGQGRWVLAMPGHSVAGVQVLVRSIVAGTVPVALPGGRFDGAAFVAAIETAVQGATGAGEPLYSALVPAQLARLLDDDRGRGALSALDAVIVGGQAVPAPLRDRATDAGVRLVRSYGSSETAGGCVYDGLPLDGVVLRIADGEVLVGGPTLAIGYLGDDERTASAFLDSAEGRWFRTGDAGALHGGVLEVTGRIDNVIVSGGVNVSLDRVEALVREHPGLGEAVIVGVDDARWGQVPVVAAPAAAASSPASSADDAVLLERVRSTVAGRLGVAARPDRLVRFDPLPLLSTGKPDRRAIAALAGGVPPPGSPPDA